MTKAQRIASSLYEQINAAWAQDDPLRTRWEQKRNEYIGSERRGPMGGVQAEDQSNSLDIPLGFLHINTLIPTIFAKDPVIDAYPATDADAPNAPIWEGLINQTLPLIRFKQIIKACLKDCMIYGEGWKKYGWSGRSKAKDPSPPVPGENGTAPPQDFVSQALSAQGYLVQPGPVPRPKPSRTLPSTGEASSAPLTWLLKDGPWVSRLAPQDVVVDPWSPDRDPTMARFIAIKFIKPLAEVRATPGYKIPANFKPKRGQSGGTEFMWSAGMVTADDSGKGRRDGGGELPGNPVVFWEVWVYDLYLENEENPEGDPIRVYRRVLTLLDGADEPIRDVGWEELLGTDYVGYPIHRIAANEVPDEPPMGELEATGPLQDAINTLARKALANINRFARMGLVDSKALVDGETALERLKKGEDGTYEKTKGSPKDVFAPLPSPGNSPETYTMLNTLMEVYQLVSGISANRKGEADARTATEARIIEGATSIKVQEKDDSVRDFCEAGIMTLIALFKSFVDRQYVIRRLGTGGNVQWLNFGPENLREMPDIRIRFESTKAANQQKEIQKWGAAMPVLVQLKQFIPTIRLDIAAGMFLHAIGVENVSELMGYPLGPNQREQQWMEIAMMMAGFPVPPQKGEAHPLHMAVNAEFRMTPAYAALPPQVRAWIDGHDAGHAELLQEETQQQSDQSKAAVASPLDNTMVEETSPANQARREERPEASLEPSPIPGGSNEY